MGNRRSIRFWDRALAHPFLRVGLDVDGCDVSPDMLSLCREKAERESLRPHLYQQALHELHLPRPLAQAIMTATTDGEMRRKTAIVGDRIRQEADLAQAVNMISRYKG